MAMGRRRRTMGSLIDGKALKCDGELKSNGIKEQWRSVECEEEALKGNRKAFNCNKEALN